MYKVQRKPDAKAVLKNGSEVTPVCTLKDEYGGKSHIIVDDSCYVLINGSDDRLYGMTQWWYEEAVRALRDLPVTPKEALIPPIGKGWKDIVKRLEAKTPEEFKQSLIDAGIITKSGKLRKKYRRGVDNSD